MPRKLLGPCRSPGCPNLVAKAGSFYCYTHLAPEALKATRRHFADQELKAKRDPDYADYRAFYRSPFWRRLRRIILDREPFCRACGAPAEMVDHINPIHEGGAATDDANLQPLCNPCHHRKRGQEGAKAAAIRRIRRAPG